MDQARLKARQQQPAAQQQQQPSSGGGFLAMKGALLENKDALQASAVAQVKGMKRGNGFLSSFLGVRAHSRLIYFGMSLFSLSLCLFSWQADFLLALKKVSKSVGKEDLARFQNWMDEFGSA